MVLLVILAAIIYSASACKEYYAQEAKDSVPTVTVVGTYDGCKVTKEVWTSKKGNVVAESFYFEKDGYVLKLYKSHIPGGKGHFRYGRTDVPKPDVNRLVSGVFTDKPIPSARISGQLKPYVDEAVTFSNAMMAFKSDIVAVTKPWVGDDLQAMSTGSFEPIARVETRLWLSFGVVERGNDEDYVLDGPWWLQSSIVLQKDAFTICVDTRDYSAYRGGYLPQKGTAVIRGTYDGNVRGGKIEGTELSDYRTGLLREATAELKAIIPFAGSKLYDYANPLEARCRLAVKTLELAKDVKWDDVVPENSIIKASSDFIPLMLSTYEIGDQEHSYMAYDWRAPNSSADYSSICLFEDGDVIVRIGSWYQDKLSVFLNKKGALAVYEGDSPGVKLKGPQLKSITTFIETVDEGLIKIPKRYENAYLQLKAFAANPKLPDRQMVAGNVKIPEPFADAYKGLQDFIEDPGSP